MRTVQIINRRRSKLRERNKEVSDTEDKFLFLQRNVYNKDNVFRINNSKRK